MGLLELLKKAFSSESSLTGSDYGRNPGPVMNPRGLLNGGSVSSLSGPVRTRFGDSAPIVERAVVDRILSQAPAMSQVRPDSELLGGYQGGPVTMPFNPPPIVGTPLPGPTGPMGPGGAPPDVPMMPPVQGGGMVQNSPLAKLATMPMQPGGSAGLNLPMMLAAMRSNPQAAQWLMRTYLSGQAGANMTGGPGGIPVGYAPQVNMEMSQTPQVPQVGGGM